MAAGSDNKPKQRTHRVKHAGLKTARREEKKKKRKEQERKSVAVEEEEQPTTKSTGPNKNAESNPREEGAGDSRTAWTGLADGDLAFPPEQAFTFTGKAKAEKAARRNFDLSEKKLRVPQVDRTPIDPPPVVVAVVGPPGRYGRALCKDVDGKKVASPVLIRLRRVLLLLCANDMNSMIDIAKLADLVLLLVDASFGFEMVCYETVS
ncbi:MAG: hypothetical protein BJ554DRAFT_4824 [Olpidium bornovanus]|uniref:Uncharacterized protein n=1 Tax=Olpidium bornovanus TaxID=278681 RepID=A0A8H8DF84_9FUNG|nr:MAG: hypothetical protein BJ554DRAFT_4824 [Olpidium bornovanus]